VILVDANLLIYAYASRMRQHDAARRWLDARLAGTAPVGLPWESLLAFVRITSNPRIFERPATVRDAWGQVEAWLGCGATTIPLETERHREILAGFLRLPGMAAKLVPDAHLAALAIENGLTLQSTDADFARFPGLRWENPLAP
jgi:toxin-antitoxin system PIN domain toxin